MASDEVRDLQMQIAALADRLKDAEFEASEARREAHEAREQVKLLRDEVAAAERDQQDLRTARARLKRFTERRLTARILNRD
jgi:predicted  nucleic acid-binding Zn-ribbon protein